MRTIINIILLLLVVFLSLVLVSSIRGPIAFKKEFTMREDAVKQRLEDHRTAQKAFMKITGEFAKDYDTLVHVLTTDSFKIEKVIGDKDAVGGKEVEVSVSYVSALDSMSKVFEVEPSELAGKIAELKYVPYGKDKAEFTMHADTMTYQKILVPVIHTFTEYEVFMSEFLSDKYRRYDSSFDPEKVIGYGDLRRPTTNGSW